MTVLESRAPMASPSGGALPSKLWPAGPFVLRARHKALLRRLAFIAASFVLTLTIWQVVSTFIVGPFLIPPPLTVIQAFGPMTANGDLYRDIGMSLSRVAVGYVTGAFFALTLGLFMGRIRALHDLLDPVVQLMRFLSPTAMIPIVIIWFGIGELAKYALIFWGTIAIVLINTIVGVLRTPLIRQNAALCLGASEAQIFRLIVLPSAIPFIVIGMRLALASAFVSIIPAELLAADSGLGYLLQQSSLLLQTDRIFVALVTICFVGFLTDQLFYWSTTFFLRRYLAVS